MPLPQRCLLRFAIVRHTLVPSLTGRLIGYLRQQRNLTGRGNALGTHHQVIGIAFFARVAQRMFAGTEYLVAA